MRRHSALFTNLCRLQRQRELCQQLPPARKPPVSPKSPGPGLSSSGDVGCHLDTPLCMSPPQGSSPQVKFEPSLLVTSAVSRIVVESRRGSCAVIFSRWKVGCYLHPNWPLWWSPGALPPQLSLERAPERPQVPVGFSNIPWIPKLGPRCQLSSLSGPLASAFCTPGAPSPEPLGLMLGPPAASATSQ